VGGEEPTGERNRLTDNRLECEILISKNRLFLNNANKYYFVD
jgi:hypothetical protein